MVAQKASTSRRRLLGRLVSIAAAVSMAGFVAACGGGGSQSTSASTGTPAAGTEKCPSVTADKATFAMGSGLPSLNVWSEMQAGVWVHLLNSYESPLGFTRQGGTEPKLATSVEQPDDVTYVLKLRDGVKFWDGSPMTAEDVAFSLQRNIDEKTSAGVSYYGSVKSISVTGPNEVTIKMKKPDPQFIYVLAHPATMITSKAYAEKAGDKIGSAGFPGMGTGPMKIDSFNPRTGLTLSRFDDYWGKKATVQSLDVKAITDPQARLLALQSGDVDGVFDVPSDQLAPWQAAANLGGPMNGYLWFGWSFPTQTKPFDDVHVRRAIAYATNGSALMKATAAPGATAAPAIVEKGLFSALGSSEEIDKIYNGLPQYEFNMDKAQQELAQSSVPNGFKATTTVPNTFPELLAIASNTAQNLKQIGIQLEVKQQPEERVIPNLWIGLPPNPAHEGVGLIARLYLAAPLPDPGEALVQALHSSRIAPGGQNSAQYKNERVDQLLDEAGSTLDKATRLKDYGDVLRISQEELPYSGAFFSGAAWAVKKDWSWDNQAGPYMILRPWLQDLKAC